MTEPQILNHPIPVLLPLNELQWLLDEATQRGISTVELARQLLSEAVHELAFKVDFGIAE